jgi:heme exporter protein A
VNDVPRIQLTVEQLACHRGGRRVFENVGFALQPGQWLELRGANGVGKSSLLRLVAGLSEPEAGRIVLAGAETDAPRGTQCHYLAHADGFKTALTVRENLQFWSNFLGGGAVDVALPMFRMQALADVQAGLLSAGQKRRLALTRLVLVPRPIWLMDEPSVGLDTAATDDLRRAMTTHLAHGGVIIATTHVDLGLAPDQSLTLGEGL